ncbi:hypothetical protein CCP3SC1AL1_520022 [Gammaproteobacteria bacterium]
MTEYEEQNGGDKKKNENIEKYTLQAKTEARARKMVLNPALFMPKEIPIGNSKDYEMDILQQEMLEFYLRNDIRFRRAFQTNSTNKFWQFIVDKARLREPHHLSCIGQTRTGKSYSMLTITCFSNALYDKKTTINHISGNQYEFLQKVQKLPPEFSYNSTFQNDEDKGAIFGAGSVAKKLKLQDIQNIVAMSNISTIAICPTRLVSGGEAQYGFRTFGRDFKTRTVRFVMYNLQENSNSHLPMSCIYIPIFTEVVPYWQELENAYLQKKREWVQKEEMGQSDILGELKKRQAVIFSRNPKFRAIEHKKDKLTFISVTLGSEWTKNECEEILSMTELISQGAFEEEEMEAERVSPEEVEEAKDEIKENELTGEEFKEAEAKIEEKEVTEAEKGWEKEKEEFEQK